MKSLGTAFFLILCLGCTPEKEPALKAIDHLEAGTLARERDLERLLKLFVRSLVAERHRAIEAERERLIGEAKLEVYRRTDARIAQVIKETRTELSGLFGASAEKIEAELRQEQALARSGRGGSRERELELAAQFGAIMVAAHKHALRLEETIRSAFSQARDRALEDVNAVRNEEVSESAESLERNISELMMGKVRAADFEFAMKDAYKGLRMYVEAENALALVLKGLVGERLGESISESVMSKVNDIGRKGLEKVERKLNERLRKFDVALTEVKPPAEIQDK